MKTILIIEDNEADQFLAEVIIMNKLPDIRILKAKDGEDALNVIQNNGSNPDLLLLDINMPRMDGHQFLESFTHGNMKDIPVIVMLTSSNLDQDKEKALSYKCVRDYLIKPLKSENISKLVELVNEYS